ncbi:hypothetical protein [Flavobacterium defluvii]|uniref:Uncharacterized protein n=1 Tax=Flavobacterium defluvii TaxID=370979 RepID=A0A1M5RNW5_9FLAO|nr:hypothetical protein [Flavobacterium defluvii]SHH27896.1 hypothetical protein SAMN05443663_106266 [Flavobacterium defluvii]
MDFEKLLKGKKDHFAYNCLWKFQNENIICEANYIILPKVKTLSIYNDRYETQKNLNNKTVFGYEILLKKLKNEYSTNFIKIISLQTKECCYVLFIDDNDILVCILKSLNSNVKKILKLIEMNPSYYKKDDYLFFMKGKRVSFDFFLQKNK